MDCTHCEPVLLDLCYGELAPAHEREVRAHIHECPTCRKALSRLEAGQALARHLPDEAPSPELTDRILRAAQAHLRQRGTPLERFQGYLESMARIAMTRQVAMATMSLVIVFVGLWSIPELTHRRDARNSVLVEAPHEGEAGPSRDALASAPQPTAAPANGADESVPESPPTRRRATAPASSSDARAPRKAVAEVAAKRAERSERARGGGVEKEMLADRVKPKAESRTSAQRFAPAPPRVAAAPQAAAAPMPADEAVAELKGQSSASQPALGNTSDERKSGLMLEDDGEALEGLASRSLAPVTIEDVYSAGVERYRAEDYTAAAQLFARMLESSAPSAQRAAALLYLARSERALGRCNRAIRAYETLVRSYGSAQQSAVALSEGVACFDQLQDAAGAQRLLEHATSVPSLSAQATKTLHDRSVKAADAPAGAKPTPP
jgi:TolA-binding protein